MLIQVDIDSTLYPSDHLFREVAVAEFGLEHWPEKYWHWFDHHDLGIDLKTLRSVYRRCHGREYVINQIPYEGAVEVINEICDIYDNVEIAYISDRNEQQTSALQEWLDKNGFLRGDEYVAATKDKREWMRENRPDIVIDDRVRTLLMARFELGSYCVSLEHPHNMNLRGEVNGIYLCPNWKEIGNVLISEIIPKVETKVWV